MDVNTTYRATEAAYAHYKHWRYDGNEFDSAMEQVFLQARTGPRSDLPESNGICIAYISWLTNSVQCENGKRVPAKDSCFDHLINHTSAVFAEMIKRGWLEVSPVQDGPFEPAEFMKEVNKREERRRLERENRINAELARRLLTVPSVKVSSFW